MEEVGWPLWIESKAVCFQGKIRFRIKSCADRFYLFWFFQIDEHSLSFVFCVPAATRKLVRRTFCRFSFPWPHFVRRWIQRVYVLGEIWFHGLLASRGRELRFPCTFWGAPCSRSQDLFLSPRFGVRATRFPSVPVLGLAPCSVSISALIFLLINIHRFLQGLVLSVFWFCLNIFPVRWLRDMGPGLPCCSADWSCLGAQSHH
jgi:hypothetical protein